MIYTVTFNPAIDYVVRLNGPLQPGGINRTAAEDHQYGGKGINVSTVLTRLGVPNVALGFVAGQTGRWLAEGLAAQGVAADLIELPEGMTRINVKLRAGPQNQETEINAQGPRIDAAALAALQQKLDKLRRSDILVLAGSVPASMPADSYQQFMAPLTERGVRVVVDAAGRLLWNVLPCRPFLIKPNRDELSELFGKPLTTDAGIAACARQLQARGARNVLVSLGADGALLVDESGAAHRVGVPAGRVVNSVGAGDSMVAGFLAGYLSTGSYAQALRLGAACGSATAYSLGLAERGTIDRLLQTDF